jgi:tetratricopeptide (TPR) repeat protein
LSVRAADRLLRNDDTDIEALNLRAAALLILGRYEDALQATNRIIDLIGPSPDALLHRARVLRRLGRYGESMRDAKAVLEHEPGSWHAIEIIGFAFLFQNQYRESEK